MADHGHYGKLDKNESRQGTYVFTADGKFLTSINHLSANRMLEMMQRGLKKWQALPASEKSAAPIAIKPKHRWEDSYPSDGLVLTSYSRDIAKDGTPTSKQLPTWNRDAAWFSKSEVENMLPKNLSVGKSFQFSPTFVSRICRLHLVDLVKGQTEGFQPEEVAGSKISGRVVDEKAGRWLIDISGSTSAEHPSGRQARGMQTQILGRAEYDPSKQRFTKFEFTALGQRWGRTRFNDRSKQLERSNVGFSFELADSDQSPIVPGIIWGYHEVDWMKRPKN